MKNAGEERGATASTGDRRMRVKKALRRTLIAFSGDWGCEYVDDNSAPNQNRNNTR